MNVWPRGWRFSTALVLLLTVTASPATEDTRHLIVRDGRTLELRLSKDFDPDMRHNLVAWAEHIANALLQVYGHWPRRRWEISVVPVSASSNDPIPWAQVHRGKVDRVEFYTMAHVPVDDLKKAWTSYHELAHLLIPYRGWGDAWFSEGLATYYQNILQARAGVLSEQQMWQSFYDGFQRGLADLRFDGQPLRSVSDQMRKRGGFMRVYWSGAWYFLAVDTRLRQQSSGRHTLDAALAKLNNCCADRSMSVPDMARTLDEMNRLLLFQPLYEELRESTRVPDFEVIFASLGIDIVQGKVHLQDDGPGARLRREMAFGDAL